MAFNNQQREAFIGLKTIMLGQDRILGLYGAGGVGKTHVLKELEKYYSCCYTAPTNQAADAFLLLGCKNAMTIYKMLGFKVNEGEGKLTVDKHNPPQYHKYDVVIVDEVSMINLQIAEEIKKASRYTRFIFAGDTHQALPVGINYSPAFAMPTTHWTLTINERLKGLNNPLANLLSYLRTAIDNNTSIRSIDWEKFAGKVRHDSKILGVSVTHDQQKMLDWVRLGIGRDFYAIAYYNVTVDKYNNYIQNHLHGCSEFVAGQKIIFNQGYNRTYRNGQVVEIEKIESVNKNIIFDGQILVADCVLINNEILAFKNKDQYKGFLDAYAGRCKSFVKGYDWVTYFKYKNGYADISHCYAITGHKSQGLTRDIVAVDMSDIMASVATNEEKLRLAYTACSRARFAIAVKV